MKHVDFVRFVVGPLQDAGVQIDSVRDGMLGWHDIMEIVKLAIDGHKAVEEVKNLSRRVITGLANAAKSGRWMGGKPPYGFRVNKETGKLVIVPEEAAIVREIFADYIAGKSIRSIAHALTERGVPAPVSQSGWMPRGVHALLKNAVYYGASVWNRSTVGKYHRLLRGAAVTHEASRRLPNDKDSLIIVEDAHEAIVSESTFNAASRLLAERRSEKHKRAPQKSPNAAAFTLSGLLACGCCSHAMCGKVRWTRQSFICPGCHKRRVATLKPGKVAERCRCGTIFPIPEGDEGRSMYVCVGGHLLGSTVCRSRMVDEIDLLHAVGDDIENMIGEPSQWRDEIINALRDAARTDPVKLADRREALASIEAKIKVAAERFLTVPPALAGDVADALEGMRAERTRLENEVRELSEALAMTTDIEDVASEVVSHLRILRLHLVSGDRSKVRAVLQRFVDRIAVDFDRDAASASEVTGYRVRYRADAFTVRNLIPVCANLVQSA